MATAASLIDKTLRALYAGTREQLNVLNGAISSTSATTFVVAEELRGIQAGAVVEIDNELIYVRSVVDGTKTATVLRGHEDSTAATHADGAVVRVNPRFTRVSVFDEFNNVLSDLNGEGLFQVVTKELTYNSAVQGYNVTGATAIDRVLEVSYDETGPGKRWPRLARNLWDLRRDVETDDFASGFAVVLRAGGEPGRQLRVTYAAPFAALSATTDDVQTVSGLPSTANDLLVYGAAMRMVAWRETMRNMFESQGDTLRAQEVPAGANIGAARAWQAIYDGRLKSEKRKQKRQYPEPAYA